MIDFTANSLEYRQRQKNEHQRKDDVHRVDMFCLEQTTGSKPEDDVTFAFNVSCKNFLMFAKIWMKGEHINT